MMNHRFFHLQLSLVMAFGCLALLNFSNGSLFAQQAPKAVDWSGWNFLIGDWIGEGSGDPGQGSGGFTFSPDLQNSILVRKNYAEYPATKDRKAFRHDDLMIVYREACEMRAIYFDNERHLIHYSVGFAEDSGAIVFLSKASASSPGYRLTYSKMDVDKVKISFEIASPDRPEIFKRYIEATARKKL